MIRIFIKAFLLTAFIYVGYVFFYGGKKPSYLDYLIFVLSIVIAICFDWKAIERKTGQSVSLKENLEFFVSIYKEMFYFITFKRWRDRRRANRQSRFK